MTSDKINIVILSGAKDPLQFARAAWIRKLQLQRFFARKRRGLRMTESIPLFQANDVRVSRLAGIVQCADTIEDYTVTGL